MRKQRGLSDAAAAAFVTPNTREAGGGGGWSVCPIARRASPALWCA